MGRAYPPTARQLEALRWIRGYQLAHGGVSPRLADIAAALGLQAKSGAHRVLEALEDRGLIRRLKNRERAIEILVPVAVPHAPDGRPLFFVKIQEGISDG
mgnify:CR=1 FL=1